MTAAQRTLAELAAGLLVLVGGFFAFRDHERHVGQLAQLAASTDSSITAGTQHATTLARIAQDAQQVAEQARDKARAQIVAQNVLQATTDSVVKGEADARQEAEKMVADSQATIAELRAGLDRLVHESRADSLARSRQAVADGLSIRDLVANVRADSLALAAEKGRSTALQALNGSVTKALQLAKSESPSFLARHVYVGVGYGLVLHSGIAYAGPTVSAGIRF